MLSVWHKADIYRIPIYAPVTPKLFWSNLSAKQKSHAEDNLGMALMMFCRDTKRKSCEKAQFGRGGAEL